MSTTEDVFKANTWLRDQQMVDAMDQLTDPFAIVPDQHKKQLPQRCAANESTAITEHAVFEGYHFPHSSPPPHCDLISHAAVNFFGINECTNIGRAGAAQKTSRPNRIADHVVHTNLYAAPERMNPHENGLRRSPRLREQREK